MKRFLLFCSIFLAVSAFDCGGGDPPAPRPTPRPTATQVPTEPVPTATPQPPTPTAVPPTPTAVPPTPTAVPPTPTAVPPTPTPTGDPCSACPDMESWACQMWPETCYPCWEACGSPVATPTPAPPPPPPAATKTPVPTQPPATPVPTYTPAPGSGVVVQTATLLDTSGNCVSDPRRDRAFGVESFAWKGHSYLMLNRGNELEIFNIDQPSAPKSIARSNYQFGTAGDSDYDLIVFDVCDDCRYGVFYHKVEGVVVFDLGLNTYPKFSGHAASMTEVLGGMAFKHAGQDYVVTAPLHACGGGSGVFIPNGDLVQCFPYGFRMGQSLHVGATTYLYLGENRSGQTYVYSVTGSGGAVAFNQTSVPTGMKSYGNALSIDPDALIAASADFRTNKVSLFDLQDPGKPALMYTIDHKWVSDVDLRSGVLASVAVSDINSVKVHQIKDSGPEPIAPTYWGDKTLPHNAAQACALDMGLALSADGATLYWSRYSLSQVFRIQR